MGRSSDGKLFHVVGPEMEKAWLPSFVLVLIVTAELVVDDLSRLLAESDTVKVTRLWRYAGQQWWKTSYIRVWSSCTKYHHYLYAFVFWLLL